MAYTSHGHHIPGTTLSGPVPEYVARCGGPALCEQCNVDGRLKFIIKHNLNDPPYSETGQVMEFNTFVRKPFTVEAIEVTKENIEELAPLIGTVRTKEDGTPYIQVDRRLVPNIYRVYPGFWVTKMGDNVRCYSKRIFNEQFVQSDTTVGNAVEIINGAA